MDDLIFLSEEKAVTTYFGYRNFQVYQVFLWLSFFLSVLLGYLKFNAGQILDGVLHGGNLILLAFLFLSRNRKSTSQRFYNVLMFYMWVQVLILMVSSLSTKNNEINYFYLLVMMALPFFRLRLLDTMQIFVITGLLAGLDYLIPWQDDISLPLLVLALAFFVCGIIIVAASTLYTKYLKERFLEDWLDEVTRNKDRVRMRRELEHAQQIQLSFLPKNNPDLSGLQFAGMSLPATEVGGDYYDYFQVSESELVVVMGDVSGHGVASGLVLSGVRSCLYLLREQKSEPAQLLGKLNRMLKQTTDRRTFMTFVYLSIDVAQNRFTLANAGHPPIYHYQAQAGAVKPIQQKALPLGGIRNAEYKEASFPLHQGDVFLLYSDGATEAWNDDREAYGDERLFATFSQLAKQGLSADIIRQTLYDDVATFMGAEEQLDDITLVVLKISREEATQVTSESALALNPNPT